jgi:DNA polymerase (family 10)
MGEELTNFLEKDGQLQSLPGIGPDLENKILEILETGTCQVLEKLHRQIPVSLRDFLNISGLGPKRTGKIYRTLGIKTIDELLQAAHDGRLRKISGFGIKTEQHILKNATEMVKTGQRFTQMVAAEQARILVDDLKQVPGVDQVVVAGSYRRCRETVGDLDILVTCDEENRVMEHFVTGPEVEEIVLHGETRATVRLHSNMQVDLRLVSQHCFGAALQYFTGSKAHNILIRRLGIQQGLKINEYGVFKGEEQIAGGSESSVYQAVGLEWIPPELREGGDEIEAARHHGLPDLVDLSDLRGDLHLHTRYSDGHADIEDMARAAMTRGYQYIAITDHSRRLRVAHGLNAYRLRQQGEKIDDLNEKLRGITIFKGIEVDILEDGELDLPDDVLGELDLVVGAVHSHFNLSRDKQTTRILKAMDHPHFSILAHPTGRLINKREPYALDMSAVIHKARERGCFLELNANPERLDIKDVYCRAVRKEKVLISINSDSHTISHLENLKFGIGQARRGWLEKKDVLNTRPLKTLQKLLRQTM